MEISILMVDDDRILVEKLEETVDWKRIGISTVFTANNIRQAQKILEEFPIEILLCDIDMPQGSGLELLEWLRNHEIQTECIFLSSYANFAYAQKALSLASREYLLKPISNYELEQVLEKVIMEITKNSRGRVERNIPHKEQVWRQILLGDSTGNYLLESYYEEKDVFQLELVKVFIKAEDSQKSKKQTVCKFLLSGQGEEALVPVYDNLWALVWKNRRKEKEERVKEARELADLIHSRVECNVCVYMSEECCTEADISQTWKRLKTVEETALPEKNGVILENARASALEEETVPWESWQKMMQDSQNLGVVFEKIQLYLKEVLETKAWTGKKLRQFMREFHQFLYVYLAQQRLDFRQVFDNVEFERQEEEAYVFLEGCIEFISYVFETLQRNQLYNQNRENAIECVKEFISKNLDKDLSRGNLAKEVYLSEDYLSRTFKMETGKSLTVYIAEQRMEKAKEYLENSNLTVSQIALEVGYHNFSYFSKTFRDITGFTPNEYRNNKKTDRQ